MIDLEFLKKKKKPLLVKEVIIVSIRALHGSFFFFKEFLVQDLDIKSIK